MPPRPDLSEARRQQILDAAMQVFARLGFDKARMEDIARRAGLAKGTLYLYFKSKEEIILGVLDQFMGMELRDFRPLVDLQQTPARERLLQMMERSLADLQRFEWLLPVLYEFYALATRNRLVRKGIQRFYRGYLEVLAPIIEQGVARGEFRQLDARQAALAISAIFEGTLVLWAFAPEEVDLVPQIRAGLQMLLESMEPPRSRRPDA